MYFVAVKLFVKKIIYFQTGLALLVTLGIL